MMIEFSGKLNSLIVQHPHIGQRLAVKPGYCRHGIALYQYIPPVFKEIIDIKRKHGIEQFDFHAYVPFESFFPSKVSDAFLRLSYSRIPSGCGTEPM